MTRIENISYAYPGSRKILIDFNLNLTKGEFIGLTGPSGCGKTTLAKIIAGHIKPSKGKILLEDQDVTGRPSRKIWLISQEMDLFMWQRVLAQVIFCQEKNSKSATKAREILKLVHLESCEELYPAQLSGGMKKRLSLARALAVNPQLLILDEAFSSLDNKLRLELREDLKAVWEKTRTTVLFITHQQEDLVLAQRIVDFNAKKPIRN